MSRATPRVASVALGMRFRQQISVNVGCLVGGAAFAAVLPLVISPWATDLLVRAFIFAVFALSLNLLWGYTGIFSLGHSAFFGIGAYGVAVVAVHMEYGAGQLPLGLILGLIAAASVAVIVGWFAFYSAAGPFYIAVITLAIALVLERFAALTSFETLSRLTGGANGLSGFAVIGLSLDGWYWLSLGLLVVAVAIAAIIVGSDFGRFLTAIRESEERMAYLGVRTRRLKVVMFVAAASGAAVAGGLFASYVQFVAPPLLGLELAVFVVILVAVGGRGTLFGPVLGSVIVGLIGPIVSARYPFFWQLILGALFVGVVVFSPDGLAPLGTRVGQWAGRRIRLGVSDAAKAPKWRLTSKPAGEAAVNRRAPSTSCVCRVAGIEKAFGSLRVLRGVDFEVAEGEVLGVIGPNGAGKSTLVNVLTDGKQLTEGSAYIFEERIQGKDVASLAAEGIGRTFQGTKLFEELAAAENLFIASRQGRVPAVWKRTREISVPGEILTLAAVTGLADYLDVKAKDLSHGLRQALEFAMALALEPRLLLLDEPTAGLTTSERQHIGTLICEVVARRAMAVVLIEHDLDFVRNVANRVAVLHRGRVEAIGEVRDIVASALVREIYLGAAS